MEKNFFRILEQWMNYAIVLMLVFAGVTGYFGHYIVCGVEVAVTLLLFIFLRRMRKKREQEVMQYLEDFSNNIDTLPSKTVANFPLPIALVRKNGRLSWYNHSFTELMTQNEGEQFNKKNIEELIPDITMEKVMRNNFQTVYKVVLGDRHYSLYATPVKSREGEEHDMAAMYLMDQTEMLYLKKELQDHKNIVGIILIDSYDELIQQENDVERTNIMASIDNMVDEWAKKYHGLLLRFRDNRYLLLTERKYYKQMEKDKFSILDEVKEIVVGESHIPVTLSIGVGKDSYSFIEKYDYARTAIEIALGRGGDQVVVKAKDLYEYYGGKSKELEKRTKVKSRVMATALKEMMKGSDNVYIMGHRFSDLDAVGAAIGISRIARNFGKNPKIVLNNRNHSIVRLVEYMEKNKEFEDTFITVENSLPIMTDKTLVVVVDTHSSRFVESPLLLQAATKLVVIDHHRRGEYFIDNATLMFHEPYASSTCEMVTEVLGYLEKDGKLTGYEANALLAGMILDTKSFTIKTGARTFEAASYLKRLGADTVEAKRFFNNTLDEYRWKINFINTAEFFGNIVICTSENEGDHLDKELFAQATDELMAVEGIDASFGIARFGDQVHVSARSYGMVNVQVIIERLGGGGHQTMAGVQLKGKTTSQVKAMLINAIFYPENLSNSEEE